MRISVDRAIQILDPEHREHYESLDEVNEACRMGMEALKAIRWIPVEEGLPQAKDEYGWVDCIVNVVESRWPRSTYDVVDAPASWDIILVAKFDTDQKIWHVDERAVNALIKAEDAPADGWWVSHWMPLPQKPPDE